MNFSGVIPALVTPFDSYYRVDYGALRALVNRLIEEGVGGFYACGSTAECFLLSDEERIRVAETVLQEAAGHVPVVVHVGSLSLTSAIKFAQHAESAGAFGVSSVPPFYYKFSFDEIVHYYEAISRAVGLPFIIYNFPAFSGVTITADNLGSILSVMPVYGLKYTSYDLFELEKISRRYPELKLFNGHDEIFLNAQPIGVEGAIGSTFNVMAPLFRQIQSLYEKERLVEAAALQHEANRYIEVFIKCGVTPSIKYLLTKGGIECGSSRPPFAPLTDEQKTWLDLVYDQIYTNAK